MPLTAESLDGIARTYVASMTSIRGRRVHRLIIREFRRFDHVFLAGAGDDRGAVLAIGDDGGAALCRTDGRGPVVCIDAWTGPDAPRLTTCFDLKRDSLPVVTRTAGDADFSSAVRTIVLSQAELRRLSGNPVHAFFRCGPQ